MLLNPYRFGVPSGGDPNFANVSLLLHMDGTNGSTTFTDNSPTPKTVTAVGNAQISTAQSKFGGASAYFDGSGDYLSVGTLTPAGSPFCVECWVFITNMSGGTAYWDNPIISECVSSGSGEQLFRVSSDGSVRFNRSTNVGGAFSLSTAAGLVNVNTWQHVALTSDGTTARIFVGGVLSAAAASSAPWVSTSNPLEIGRVFVPGFPSFAGYFVGYIDDLRITKGVARYTANFTPPTAAFPDF